MVSVSKRPVKQTNNDVYDGEEKTYRSRTVKLDNGGINAEEGDYAGETIIIGRVVPRMTRIRGSQKAAFSLEGVDPVTGEALILFFDTRLKEDGSYVRNFGGGLAEMLCTSMTEEEFDKVTEILNIENGADYAYNIDDWEAVGGALKLKDKFYGKVLTIGKECVKIKNGKNMNVFAMDIPEEAYDPEQLAAFFGAWEATVGQPPEKAASSSSKKAKKVESKKTPSEPVTSANGSNVKQPTAYEKEVAKQNGSTKKTKLTVEQYINSCKELGLNDAAIVACLTKDYGITVQDAQNHVNASKIPEPAAKPTVKEPEKTLASMLIEAGKACAKEGLTVPESYGVLSDRFKDANRDQIRNALTIAGVMGR